MSRKHTAKEFNKSNKWLAIGVDLAKYDNTIVGITEDGEVQIIERISTAVELSRGFGILNLN